MKTLLALLLLAAVNASAQFGYTLTDEDFGSTTYTIALNTYSNHATSFGVQNGHYAQIQISYKMMPTNAGNYFAVTNAVAHTFDLSIDGSHWTNQFTLLSAANSNNTIWIFTNYDVSAFAYLRHVATTNYNTNALVTNMTVAIGQKTGL